MEQLKGSMSGPNRADIIKDAREVAAKYFGTGCVMVRLRDEGSETLRRTMDGSVQAVMFSANFDAWEHHDVESRSYGPGVCRGCKAPDWPHDRLKRAPGGSK